MSVAPYKLYYRKSGTTYNCELYTTLAEIGNPSHYLAVNKGGTTYYCLADTISGDSNNSYLRINKGGTTLYVKSKSPQADLLAGEYTQVNFVNTLRNFIANGASRSLAAPVSLEIKQIGTITPVYAYRRNITIFKRMDSSSYSTTFPVVLHNGQYLKDGTWTNVEDMTWISYGLANTVSSDTRFNVILHNNIYFV